MLRPSAVAAFRTARRARAATARSLWAALAAAGCAPDHASDPIDDAEIVTGREATTHPDVCLVRSERSACTGDLVAPNVVLTAAHCVAGSTSWTVLCPYARDRGAVGVVETAIAPSYPGLSSQGMLDVNAGSDIALLRLARSLDEPRVGRAAPRRRVAPPERVVAFGRVVDGQSTDQIFASSPLRLGDAHPRSAGGFWVGIDRRVLQRGDSGGPLKTVDTGEIVGVNSAGCDAGPGCSYWTLLAPAAAWFTSNVARLRASGPPPVAPEVGCDSALNCDRCVVRADCGWCAGRCVPGTREGGAACSRRAADWGWTEPLCRSLAVLDLPGCRAARTCLACTERLHCGWCDGVCRPGSSNGPFGVVDETSGVTCAAPWSWEARQCR